MGVRAKLRHSNLGWAILLITTGALACAPQPGPPPVESPGPTTISIVPRKPDPECVARCQKHLEEALRVCDDLFNSPRSQHHKDQEWRRQCLEQAKTQYDICVSFCEK